MKGLSLGGLSWAEVLSREEIQPKSLIIDSVNSKLSDLPICLRVFLENFWTHALEGVHRRHGHRRARTTHGRPLPELRFDAGALRAVGGDDASLGVWER